MGGNTFPTNKESLVRGNGYGSTLSGRDKSSRRSLYTDVPDDKDTSSQSPANGGMYGNSPNQNGIPNGNDRDYGSFNIAKNNANYNQFSLLKKKKIKMPPTVFDEYEQRGGVLEEYEDLNSDAASSEDRVLSQMHQSPSNQNLL